MRILLLYTIYVVAKYVHMCTYMLLSLGSFLKGGVAARLVLQGSVRPGVCVASLASCVVRWPG